MTAQAATSVQGFHAPASIAEAISAKAELGEGAMFLAGGTDLGVLARRQSVQPVHLISLGDVDALAAIRSANGEIVVGAAVTHRAIEISPLFSGSLAGLVDACRTVGSVQTRMVGTVGGNLCNASPAADTPPVLLALGASVTVAGPDGERTMPLDEFLVGYRRTALADGELLTAVLVPEGGASSASAFVKLGRRKAMEISIACAGVRMELAGDGTIASAGIALGSVSPTSVRAVAAEQALLGAVPGPEAWALAGSAALDVCDPIDDVRATAAYRLAMVPVLVARALTLAASRLQASP